MTKCFQDFLKKQDVEYYENLNISHLSSIGIGTMARFVVFPNSIDALINTVNFIVDKKIKFKILGRLTNVLPQDEFYNGVLLLTRKLNRYYVAENVLNVECGAKFSKIISELADINFGGMEKLFGIPGSVGGMVYGNAGAYGVAVSDFLINAYVYSPSEKKILLLSKEDLNFSYRYSSIKDTDLILLNATFTLINIPSESVKNNIRQTIEQRKNTQPFGEKSIGSVFKRNGDIPISRLIDNLGLKGLRVGGAEVSKKHAGFIVNVGGATAKDYIELVEILKHKIKDTYGIQPEEEIEILN